MHHQSQIQNRRSKHVMRRYQLYFLFIFFVVIILACVFALLYYLPARASMLYGLPASQLSIPNRIEYSARLLSYGDELTTPLHANGTEQRFKVEQGESVRSIANRLEVAGFISNAQAFYDYAVYTGIDLTIQAGDFTLSPAQSIIDIAQALQKFSPSDATIVILPGWRMEEIAASLSTSGLEFTTEAFFSAVNNPPQVLNFASPITMEGFFFPDTYTLPRATTPEQFLDTVARNFVQHLSADLTTGFENQGLSVYQAVILASIVEREAIRTEESALIASVYLNRFAIGMKLDADPTVQYAVGYNPTQATWWTNPISAVDLDINSPYNTYLYTGLPPAPISNPGIEALHAVAYPEVSPYYYFRAKCDGSGYHLFAATLEEQVANACP